MTGNGVNDMPFCTNCGVRITDNAKFCTNCGVAVKHNSSYSYNSRGTVYEGKIHKCPNCGEVLDSFRSHCPSCGCEIRDTNSSNSVKELTQKLERIEAERMAPIEDNESLMKRVFGKDFKEEDEVKEAQQRFDMQKLQQKANLIVNFSVPNTREDILEFMILASSNIDVKKIIYDEVSKAWLTKFDQVYGKAKLLMGNEPSFAQIKYIYDRKKAQIKNEKYKGLATACFCIGILSLLFSLVSFMEEPSVISFISLLIGMGALAGGIKCIFVYNKNKKLTS